MDSETALITASSPIIVTVLQIGSCSSYLPLPSAALGTEYRVIVWNTSSSSSSWFYITSERQATVHVTFRGGGSSSCRIRSGNLTFFCGDDLSLDLSPPASTVLFTSTSDLSGTYIQSDTPVSVIAGNTNTTTIGVGSITDSTSSEQFPVYSWGRSFAVAPAPNNDAFGYSLKIGSGRRSASVTISTDSNRTYLVLPDSVLIVTVPGNQPAFVTADFPIQVVQFINSGNAGGGGSASGAPAALSIPARERYAKSYMFGSVLSFTNYISIVIEGSAAPDLRLNDQPTSSDGWKAVPGSTMVTRAFVVAAGASGTVSHPTQGFGAFRFSYIVNDVTYGTCELAYPAGAIFPIAQVSSSTSSQTPTPTTSTSTQTRPTTLGPPSQGNNLLARDCSCLNITSNLQPSYDGYYYSLNETLNGQSTFKRRDCDLYLFLYIGIANYWIVGPRPGSNVGMLINSAIFQSPVEAQRWEGYNSTSEGFVPDPSMSVSCSCPATSCQSVEFVRPSAIVGVVGDESVFDGVFVFTNTTFNARPVFRHTDRNLFLFYQQGVTGSCKRWVVSSSIGGSSSNQPAVLYANDGSLDAGAIPTSTVWRYFRGGSSGFVDEPDIDLRCYPVTSGVPT